MFGLFSLLLLWTLIIASMKVNLTTSHLYSNNGIISEKDTLLDRCMHVSLSGTNCEKETGEKKACCRFGDQTGITMSGAKISLLPHLSTPPGIQAFLSSTIGSSGTRAALMNRCHWALRVHEGEGTRLQQPGHSPLSTQFGEPFVLHPSPCDKVMKLLQSRELAGDHLLLRRSSFS